MKQLAIILFTLALNISLKGNVDSLFKCLQNSSGELKIDLYNEIAQNFHRNNEDSALTYANLALNNANTINYKQGILTANLNLAITYLQLSEYKKTLHYCLKSLKLAEELKDIKSIGEVYSNMSNAYLNMFNFEMADKYNRLAAEVYLQLKDSTNLGIIYNNIAVSFDNRNELDSALYYYKKAFPLYEKIKVNKELYLGLWYTNVGDLFRKQGKHKDGFEMQKRAEPLLIEADDQYTLLVLYSGIPYTLIEMKDYGKALDFAKKAEVLGIKLNAKRELAYAVMSIADVYEAMGDLSNQVIYLKKYINLSDSVFNDETSRAITEMQTKYESEKKEKEIQLLNKDRQLQSSEIEKHKSKQLLYAGIIALSMVIAVLLAFWIKNVKRNNRVLFLQKEEIATQKQLVEIKQKEIIDSITYAKRIQEALLPSKKYIERNIKRLKSMGKN
ncbi:MAG: tetratricopeptide repeat protein [Flavobacteriales bacterium]